MTNEDAVKWIKNLKDDIGTHHHASLWHYEQALCEIIELLKEKQPRVLDYEELFHEETFSLWFEDKEHLLLLHVACVDGEYEDMHVNIAVEDNYENWSTYGKTWRMWNEIPTDEQRKAVPWKDGDGE